VTCVKSVALSEGEVAARARMLADARRGAPGQMVKIGRFSAGQFLPDCPIRSDPRALLQMTRGRAQVQGMCRCQGACTREQRISGGKSGRALPGKQCVVVTVLGHENGKRPVEYRTHLFQVVWNMRIVADEIGDQHPIVCKPCVASLVKSGVT